MDAKASTGLPKLTVYTHGNIVIEADIFRELFSLQEEDIIFQDRPVGWIAAFHLPYLATGAPRIMTDGRTQLSETYIDAIWATIAEEKVTLAHLTPQTVARLLALPDLLEQHPSQPRSILMTGQPLRKRFAAVIGTLSRTMFTSYGLTECGYITSGLCRTADDFDDCLVGRSSASTEVRIVDENLKPLPPGKTGEVLARSKSRFMGYFRDEEKTKLSMLDDGWVRTDDLGYLDDRGQLYVFGRRSDAIMRGVVIVYPHEIERRLSTISGVHDVMVVGVPDPELFQEICACVVLDPGSTHTAESLKTLSDAINAQTTEDLPISPKYFLLFDAALPTTATGKVSRKLLQQEATKRLGLQN
nr:hypothetical protein BaRGS_029866 [Batillaria attramentaria]